MNATENSDRQWEQALATVLREQAPMADGASSLVGPSIHRAGRIRRRRQLAVTAAGVVAVAAVATPIAMGAFGRNNAATQPGTSVSAPASGSVSASAPGSVSASVTGSAPATSAASSPTTLSIAALPTGAAPKVTWIEDQGRMAGNSGTSTIHFADGTTVQTPFWARRAAVFGTGVIAEDTPNGAQEGPQVVILDAKGKELDRFYGRGPVASADGSRVAVWRFVKAGDSKVQIFDAKTGSLTPLVDTTWNAEGGYGADPIGFVDADRVIVSPVTEGGTPVPMLVDMTGTLTPVPQLAWVAAVAPSVHQVVASTYNPASAVVYSFDGTPTMLWSTTGQTPEALSADGTLVVTSDPLVDTTGVRTLTVTKVATQQVVATFTVTSFAGVVFEDASHLVFEANDGTAGGLLRCSVDGTCELAVKGTVDTATASSGLRVTTTK
ncbi:MAG: hypothetical protein WAW82_15200 [Candidatus Lutibacillus vidarii]|jgi:hypothetical protein|nr:hypothetical protein [Dermatophilaceae bacterium]